MDGQPGVRALHPLQLRPEMVFLTHEDQFDIKLFESLYRAPDDRGHAVIPAHGIDSNSHANRKPSVGRMEIDTGSALVHGDDRHPLVVTARQAGPMRQHAFVTLGANGKTRHVKFLMCATLIPSCFGMSTFGIGHCVLLTFRKQPTTECDDLHQETKGGREGVNRPCTTPHSNIPLTSSWSLRNRFALMFPSRPRHTLFSIMYRGRAFVSM